MNFTRGKPKTVYLMRDDRARVERYAKQHRLSFSKALSELVLRGFNEWALSDKAFNDSVVAGVE